MTVSMLDITNATSGAYQAPNMSNVAQDKAKETAQEFEAFFIGQFIETLTAGIATDGAFGGGQGEKIFRSMLSQEYAKSVAKVGGMGIADTVYQEIIKIQEEANK
jgi:peptidoglycan hydrolase FlgJ